MQGTKPSSNSSSSVGFDNSGVVSLARAERTPDPAIQPRASPESKHTKNLTQTDLTQCRMPTQKSALNLAFGTCLWAWPWHRTHWKQIMTARYRVGVRVCILLGWNKDPNIGGLIISSVRNSNLGLCIFAFKCCVSQLSVN